MPCALCLMFFLTGMLSCRCDDASLSPCFCRVGRDRKGCSKINMVAHAVRRSYVLCCMYVFGCWLSPYYKVYYIVHYSATGNINLCAQSQIILPKVSTRKIISTLLAYQSTSIVWPDLKYLNNIPLATAHLQMLLQSVIVKKNNSLMSGYTTSSSWPQHLLVVKMTYATLFSKWRI